MGIKTKETISEVLPKTQMMLKFKASPFTRKKKANKHNSWVFAVDINKFTLVCKKQMEVQKENKNYKRNSTFYQASIGLSFLEKIPKS